MPSNFLVCCQSSLDQLYFLNLERLAGGWRDYLITINCEDEAAAKMHRLLPESRIFYTLGIGLELDRYARDRVEPEQITAIGRELKLKPDEPFNHNYCRSLSRSFDFGRSDRYFYADGYADFVYSRSPRQRWSYF